MILSSVELVLLCALSRKECGSPASGSFMLHLYTIRLNAPLLHNVISRIRLKTQNDRSDNQITALLPNEEIN